MKLIRDLLAEEDILLEQSQRIAALRLNPLEDLHLNHKVYKKISLWSPGAKLIETTSTGIKLYQQSKGSEHEIYALDDAAERIAYYVRYEVQKADFVDESWCTQVLVWRGTGSSNKTQGLSEYVFFTYILPIEGTVVSDGEQTVDGERFWKYRIAKAFTDAKYKVYLVDFNQKTVKKFKTKKEFEILLNTKHDPWGDVAWHKGIRLAISDHDLIQE